MGSGHDPANADIPCGVSAYSCGYLDDTEAFRTVMAYDCAGGCTRVDHFSNPNVTYAGRVTGVADAMDNARSINDTRAAVASWRTSTTNPPPPPVTYTILDTSGEWSVASEESIHRPGAYAEYYTFTLTKSAVVTIDLVSSTDTYLFLLDSAQNIIEEDDDGGDSVNSKIVRTLAPGTYKIEATTFSTAHATGTFTLQVIGLGEAPTAFLVPIINYLLN